MRNEHEDLYLADAARDAARWEEAVSRYRSLLEVRPTESGLLVQLGHCHKEAGQFALAERAYLQAKVLRPDDMDVLLQLGHLYKISGRRTEAIAHYRTAIAGGLNDEHAKRYLEQNTTVEPLDGAAGLVPSVFLECSDLLEFLRNHRFPTGIQRVQIELLKAAALHGGDDKLYACTFEPRLNWWIAVGLDELTTLFEQMVDSTRYSDAIWEAAQAEFRAKLRRRQRLDFSPGATLINIGTSWWITDYMALIRNAKADCGLRFVPLVYDLIPMIVPQYVGEGMSAAFSDWAFSLFMHADLVAAISQSTARDIARIAARVRPTTATSFSMNDEGGHSL